MYKAVLALSLVVSDRLIPLEAGVIEMPARKMAIPILLNKDRMNEVDKMNFYVSTDRGKNWKLHGEYKPTDIEALFEAPRDGSYWFALLIVFKDGHSEPANAHNLQAGQKVYVNTQRRICLSPNQSNGDLIKENAQLKEKVNRLQKRIEELEKQKPN
jgi:hypothetical protein